MSWAVHLYWLLGFGGVGFLLVEMWAVWHRKRENTLSNSFWVWLGTFSHPKSRWLRVLTLQLFIFGLDLHFVFGWKAWWTVIPEAIPIGTVIFLSTFVWKEKS